MSLQIFAPAGVEFASHKKQRDDGDENKVSHELYLPFAASGSADVSSALNCLSQCRGPAGRRRSQEMDVRPVAGQGQPPVELNCSRSCPHHGAMPTRLLIKRWAAGVKKVLRNDLPKKLLSAGHRNQPQNAAGLNTA